MNFRKYTQTNLQTGEEVVIEVPPEIQMTEEKLLSIINSLNREAATYGCFYCWKGTE